MEYLTSNFYIRLKKNAVKLILITHVMLFSKKYLTNCSGMSKTLAEVT